MEMMPKAQKTKASNNIAVKKVGGKRILGISLGNTERSDEYQRHLEVRRNVKTLHGRLTIP